MNGCLSRLIDVLERHKPERSRAYFHYCPKPVLEKFLEPGAEIFCTHTRYLNDDREIREGCDRFLSFLSSEKGFPDSVVEMLRGNIDANINRFDPRAKDLPNVMPWTFSVSEAEDAPYQWKHYVDCQAGGYRIAFNTDRLEETIAAVNKANAQSMLPVEQRAILVFLPCMYLGFDDVLIAECFHAAYKDFERAFEKVRASTPEKDCDNASGVQVLSAIFFVASLIKRGRYRHEREWRLILHATDSVKHGYEMVGGKPRLRTLLSAGVSGRVSDLVCQVMRSPQGDVKALTRHAQLLLQKYGSVLHVYASAVDSSVVLNYITRCPVEKGYEDYVVERTTENFSASVVPQEEWMVRLR